MEENEYFMKFLVLSYVGPIGPRVFLHVPESIKRSHVPESIKKYVLISDYVPLLMNLMTPYKDVFFINEFGEIKSKRVKIFTGSTLDELEIKSDNLIFTNPSLHKFSEMKSANLIFTVPNPVAKYEEEWLMISIVIRNEENVDCIEF
ncbi:MAG TPA: hypothetical protein ENI29_04015 [bacterium]|nr:hypothetical protein [archaeon]HEC37377.1 hypothetical protein [bacterium]